MIPLDSTTMRRRRLAPILVALLAASGAAWAGEAARELLCAPSAKGCVTSWLFTGPMQFLRAEQFDRDFLKAAGGEAAARPREGDVADPVSGLAWQARIVPRALLNFGERSLSVGESVFYFSAVFVPRKDFEATVRLTHTGWARLWLNGKSALRSDYDPYGIGYRTAEGRVALRKGRRVHCLLKLGSKRRGLQFIFALLKGGRPVGPDDLAVALPLGQGGAALVAPHVFSSLSLGLGRERFVRPGQPSQVVFGVQGGYPECSGKVSAEVTIKNAKGRIVGTLEAKAVTMAALARAPAQLVWTPPAEGATASYDLIARVSYDGKEIGALSTTVYAPSEIRQWTQDLVRRLQAALKSGKVPRDAFAHVLLKIEKAAILQGGASGGGFAADEVHRELKLASQWLARLDKGQPVPPPVEPGVHEHAYLAEQDDSPQPYYLHIPRGYTAKKPVPAIVYLHGYAPDLDKINWHMPSTALTDQADARGYVIIIPFARSNTDFQAIGETDVLHVLELAKKRLQIDPDRTFLVGYSMGGMGAYTIAAHYPHLWAGVVAMCARADYYFWKGLDPEKVEPFKRHLLDMEFGWPLAGNFLHVPVLAYQGTHDMLIKPEQAYRFVDRLTRLGAIARLVRLEGQNHWIADEVFSTPAAFDWMDRQRRNADPQTIRFTTYSLRYNRAHWLTINAFVNQGRPASVDLTLRAASGLTLVSRNVGRLTLRPPKSLRPRGGTLRATINGTSSRLSAGSRGEYVIRIVAVPKTPYRKSRELCGPIKDAFNRRFLFVYGTAGAEEATKANRRAARQMRSDWAKFAKGAPRLIADTALTPEEIARSNLFLFGTPKTHATLARIAAKLPIRFTPKGYLILNRLYEANDTTGLMFIHPNPLAPKRYVVVCSGAYYGEKLGVNHKYDLLPDFIVYSTEADYDDSNAYYCAGFFDNIWRLDKSLTWTAKGVLKPRPAAKPLAVPHAAPFAPEQPVQP